MGGEGGGTQCQTNQQLNAPLTTWKNYSRAANAMGRPWAVTKCPTLATVAAGTQCRQGYNRAEDAWESNITRKQR